MRKSDFDLNFYTISNLFVFYQESPGFQGWNLYFPKKSILYTLKWDIVGVIAINICWDIN